MLNKTNHPYFVRIVSTEAALAIFQEHCTNVNSMGPCEEASGTESTYSQLIEGKYPTLTQINEYNYQHAQNDATNDYNWTASATGANDQYPDDWYLTRPLLHLLGLHSSSLSPTLA